MKPLLLLLAAIPALAAITGTVTNQTIGKPAANVAVTLYKFGGGGMEPVDKVQTDSQGNFTINQAPAAQGPSMLRVAVDGVNYNQIIPPGSPATNIPLTIYNASKKPGAAAVSKHMLLFEPNGGQLTVNETFLYKNDGKTTWADPQNGTLRFFLPAGAESSLDVKAAAPDSRMSVPVPTEKSSQPNVYVGKFEIKPGETRFDLTYSLPYTEGAAYAGRIPTEDENTYLIVPDGVTIEGQNMKDLGQEPRTQARIFGLQSNTYNIKLSGAAVPAADAAPDQADSGSPPIEQIMPRVYGQVKLILGLTLGILALGFTLLYRAHAPAGAKETHERGRS